MKMKMQLEHGTLHWKDRAMTGGLTIVCLMAMILAAGCKKGTTSIYQHLHLPLARTLSRTLFEKKSEL